VLYAVLLAFAIIVVWQKFSDAEFDVVREAGAAENIYRLSQGLTDKGGVDVREAVANYLKVTMDNDWPAMNRGKAVAGGAAKQALDAVYAALLSSDAQSNGAVVSEMLRQLELITQARRARLVASQGAVPNVIWLVAA
jgi:acyl-coenzyme A thioesterase PaaI-like protein